MFLLTRTLRLVVLLLLGSAAHYFSSEQVQLQVPVVVVMAKPRKGRRKRTNTKQELLAKRMACEMDCLGQWIPEEAMNCIHFCRSPACFEQLYGEDPLEPGQVDPPRADAFDKCSLNEILESRRIEREKWKEKRNKEDDDDEEEEQKSGEDIAVETQEQVS
jgi:hypothetical protein